MAIFDLVLWVVSANFAAYMLNNSGDNGEPEADPEYRHWFWWPCSQMERHCSIYQVASAQFTNHALSHNPTSATQDIHNFHCCMHLQVIVVCIFKFFTHCNCFVQLQAILYRLLRSVTTMCESLTHSERNGNLLTVSTVMYNKQQQSWGWLLYPIKKRYATK